MHSQKVGLPSLPLAPLSLMPMISIMIVGECAHNATTGDPRVFGPDAWRTWHRFAHNYPIHPNPKTEKACVNWIRALPYMLPCTLCGLDFLDFITKNELFAGTYEYDECAASLEFDMPCQPPEVACTTRSYLVNFFLRAHHNVDGHTKPCKKLWSPQEAAITYGNEFRVWYGESVGRSVSVGLTIKQTAHRPLNALQRTTSVELPNRQINNNFGFCICSYYLT